MRPSGSAPEPSFPLWAALAVTGAGIAAMLGGSVELASRTALGLRAQIAVGTLLLAIPAVAALLLRPDLWPAVQGARRVPGRTAGLSLVLGAALWVASAGLMEVQSLVAPPPPEYLDAFRAIHQALAPHGVVDGLVSILVIAVLPGVCEELVIRGVFLPSFARGLAAVASPLPSERARVSKVAWVAVVVSALLFAAIHLDLYRFLFTFALGLVFGFLRLGTGSLWPSVVAHASLNTLTFAIAPFVDDPTKPYTPSPVLGTVCLVAGVAVAWPLLRALGGSFDSPRSRP